MTRLRYWLITKYNSTISCAIGKHRTHMAGVFCQCNCHFRVPRDAYDATRTTRDA